VAISQADRAIIRSSPVSRLAQARDALAGLKTRNREQHDALRAIKAQIRLSTPRAASPTLARTSAS
jgi:hypothetical protein